MQNKQLNHLSDWIDYIQALHPEAIELGLTRILSVFNRFNWQLTCPIITVGGTNGKGSTCALLRSILQAAGYRVGVYTSPHIHLFNERVVINDEMASDDDLAEAFDYVNEKRGDIPLTFFEFTTLAAFRYFDIKKVDVLILEVGLGGRLDAVNIVNPDVSIVTNVALDHEAYLGNTKELIGFEKACIYRAHRVGVYGENNPPQSLLDYAKQNHVVLKCFNQDYRITSYGDKWDYHGQQVLHNLPLPALVGDKQIENAANVLCVLEGLSHRLSAVSLEAICTGLQKVSLKARYEVIHTQPTIILDVGHNPHAARVLATQLKQDNPQLKTDAVYGAMADKDIDGVIREMQSVIGRWYIADLPIARAQKAAIIKQKLLAAGVAQERIFCFNNISSAFENAKKNVSKNDRIIAFGSFWVVEGILNSS